LADALGSGDHGPRTPPSLQLFLERVKLIDRHMAQLHEAIAGACTRIKRRWCGWRGRPDLARTRRNR
jgi:hypothetical protein